MDIRRRPCRDQRLHVGDPLQHRPHVGEERGHIERVHAVAVGVPVVQITDADADLGKATSLHHGNGASPKLEVLLCRRDALAALPVPHPGGAGVDDRVHRESNLGRTQRAIVTTDPPTDDTSRLLLDIDGVCHLHVDRGGPLHRLPNRLWLLGQVATNR